VLKCTIQTHATLLVLFGLLNTVTCFMAAPGADHNLMPPMAAVTLAVGVLAACAAFRPSFTASLLMTMTMAGVAIFGMVGLLGMVTDTVYAPRVRIDGRDLAMAIGLAVYGGLAALQFGAWTVRNRRKH
jgi:hypothetical protein